VQFKVLVVERAYEIYARRTTAAPHRALLEAGVETRAPRMVALSTPGKVLWVHCTSRVREA